MTNGGDLYETAKILGHSIIKMTERYPKLARKHIARSSPATGGTYEFRFVRTEPRTVGNRVFTEPYRYACDWPFRCERIRLKDGTHTKKPT
jgi:hypothetical protein